MLSRACFKTPAPFDKATHFDNLGPRTTNLAKGWHNGVTELQPRCVASIDAYFLDWLERYQFEVQCRCLQLAACRPAKERRAEYARIETEIAEAKLSYSVNVGHEFCCV